MIYKDGTYEDYKNPKGKEFAFLNQSIQKSNYSSILADVRVYINALNGPIVAFDHSKSSRVVSNRPSNTKSNIDADFYYFIYSLWCKF